MRWVEECKDGKDQKRIPTFVRKSVGNKSLGDLGVKAWY